MNVIEPAAAIGLSSLANIRDASSDNPTMNTADPPASNKENGVLLCGLSTINHHQE